MAAVADAITTVSGLWYLSLTNVTRKWGHGSPLSDQSAASHNLNGDSLQGFSAGTCMPDLVLNSTDDSALALPILSNANDPTLADSTITFENITVPAITHPDLTRGQILRDASNASQYFIQWIQLPQARFNGSSIGAAILLQQTQDSPKVMVLCNLAAGWGTTSVHMNIAQNNNDDRVSSKVSNPRDWNQASKASVLFDLASEDGTDVVYWDFPRYPQKQISIAQVWAQSLNPMVRSANQTVFQLIMQEKLNIQGSGGVFASASGFKEALTLMISNGLGRVNSIVHSKEIPNRRYHQMVLRGLTAITGCQGRVMSLQ